MDFNFKAAHLFFALVLLFVTSALYAQNENSEYFLDTSGTEPVILQRLHWYGDENVLSYEIIIQRELENGDFVNYKKEITEYDDIEVSLPSGKYRFKVTPFNLFGIAAESSEWQNFTINKAYIPEIEKFFPTAFYLDRQLERKLDIAGYNFVPNSYIYLRNINDINLNNRLFPIELNVKNINRATLYFDDAALVPGTYEIVVENPGGFNTTKQGFLVGYRRPVDFTIKSVWAPVVPVFGDIKNSLGMDLYLPGIIHSLSMTSTRRGIIREGIEFFAAGYAASPVLTFKESLADAVDSWEGWIDTWEHAVWMEIGTNLLLQKNFLQETMALVFRAGGGFTVSTADSGSTFLFWNAGVSYLVMLHEIFFIEVGIDYSNHHSEVMNGFIKPRLGLGWQF